MKQHHRAYFEKFGHTEDADQETTLDQWRRARQEVGGIACRDIASPAHIAERHGVTLDALEGVLKREVAACAEGLNEACMLEAKYLPLFADLHDLWYAQKNGDPEFGGFSWTSALDSFDSFIAEFAPNASLHARAWIGKHIEWFVKEYTGNAGWLTIYPSRKNVHGGYDFTEEEVRTPTEITSPQNDWVYMPDSFPGRIETYVARPVLAEIVYLLESGYLPPDYSHASGSAALESIGEEGAIVNSLELLEKGKRLKTGERSHDMATDAVHLRGLSSIYADKGVVRQGYNTLRWFGEYYVTFGISKERQDAYMRTTDVRYEDSTDPEQLSCETIMNEGTLIGRRVPLDAVDCIYAWDGNKKHAEEWAKKHCPHARIIGLEAVCVMRDFASRIGHIAQEEGVLPIEIWRRIAQEG